MKAKRPQLHPSILLGLLLAALLPTLPSATRAASPFRGQPMMAQAYERLEAAVRKLDLADERRTEARAESAVSDLTMAKQCLENAKKNKGPARSTAIKLIEEAVPLLQQRPLTDENLSLAKEKAMQAMERVLHGAEIGR